MDKTNTTSTTEKKKEWGFRMHHSDIPRNEARPYGRRPVIDRTKPLKKYRETIYMGWGKKVCIEVEVNACDEMCGNVKWEDVDACDEAFGIYMDKGFKEEEFCCAQGEWI